jgi:DNA-binding GntR family transcriptional regulator
MAIKRTKVDIYSILKEKIQFMEWKPGSRIVEAELAEEYGVSRTPIREALKKLEEERFIDIYPQRGTYVAKIDMKLVKEVALMRHILESDIFGHLCEKKTVVSMEVRQKLIMMELALKSKDYKEYIKYDNGFHRALFNCGGHEIIWDTISGFLAHYTRVLTLDIMMADNLEKSYESHVKMVECIEAGDLKGLDAIMAVHHDYYLTESDIEIQKEHPDYFVNQ